MIVRTSSSPYSKAILEMKSPRLDSSLQRQTIVVRALQTLTLRLSVLFLLQWDTGSGHEKTDGVTQEVQQQNFLICFVILLHQELQEVSAML